MAAKRGFTLVELLTVIIILGLIGLIAIPSITGVLESSKEKLYNKQVEFIVNATREWGVENVDRISSTGKTYVSVNDLIQSGYIEQNSLKNPKSTKDDMTGCVVIEYNEPYDKYEYKYDDRSCAVIDDNRNMTSADSQYVCYDFDESTGTIVSYDVDNPECLSDVVIPNKIDDVTVRHIGPAAFINESGQSCYSDFNTTTDEVPVSSDYVRYDGDGYYGCYFAPTSWSVDITSVKLPKYLETIGTSAFAENEITEIDFSNMTNLIKINDDAFYANPLESINFTNVPNLTFIGTWAFSDTSLTSLDLSPLTSLKTIGAYAFELGHITILNLEGLNNLTTISHGAFEDNLIQNITIPINVVVIEGNAFFGNIIQSVTIEGGPARFINNWIEIGFPERLMPPVVIAEVGVNLSTSSANNFTFTNNTYYKATIPTTGTYRLEVWGAQGGSSSDAIGGSGGYSVGEVSLTSGTNVYVYVGGTTTTYVKGFNNGGYAGLEGGGRGGGGATDIRIGGQTIYNRLIVAGGGGGVDLDCTLTDPGGAGGGIAGVNGKAAIAPTETTPGYSGDSTSDWDNDDTTFGYPNNPNDFFGDTDWCGGGGGGGWYGGSAGDGGGGSGGNGYVWTAATASRAPSGYLVSSTYYLNNAQTIAGNATMPNPDGGTMTGRTGNGYARITYLGA